MNIDYSVIISLCADIVTKALPVRNCFFTC